ncbi:MAG: phosphotransferase [Tepidisphaeraceae bacterium]|jgi:Ser/Thr protein kinase RdoA (MazF antagonist)
MGLVPRSEDAAALCERFFDSPVTTIARFLTGLANYVYDVVLTDGRNVVARIAVEENRRQIEGGIFWSGVLRRIGVPLPALLFADAKGDPFAYMVPERLPGTDLANIYDGLSLEQKQTLAEQLAEIQDRVGGQPLGRGYGFVSQLDDPAVHRTWRSVLDATLARAYERVESVPGVEVNRLRRIEAALAHEDGYLSAVAPRAFLDDITTKNVIIDAGRLTGIVDVDEICFGDPLFTLGLTRMSLLARGRQVDYIDDWVNILELNARQLRILDLYTAIHCTTFIGELGQRFNKDAVSPIDRGEVNRLLEIFDGLLSDH